jgi:hypothetical protein
LLTAIIIIDLVSTLIAFFALARTGRILSEQHELIELFVFSHNSLINRFKALNEKTDHALDCLVTVDAVNASSPSDADEILA